LFYPIAGIPEKFVTSLYSDRLVSWRGFVHNRH